MKNNIIYRFVFGIFIGIDIGLFMSIFFSYIVGNGSYQPAPTGFISHFPNELSAMLISILIWAAIGALFSTTSLIFTHTEFSITKMTLLHCVINYIVFVPLSIVAGWYGFNLAELASFTIVYIIIYIIIWIVFMFINMKHIREINAKLKK